MEQQETQESLGEYLKRSRSEKNISTEQVAYATRISLRMLRALEENDHTVLPAPTFVRGYLQAYAKYVSLDSQDLLLRYQHHLATSPHAKKSPLKSHYLFVRERYQEKRRLLMVLVLFSAMLAVAGTYFYLKSKREKMKRLAITAEKIESQPVKEDIAQTTATKTEEATKAATTTVKEDKPITTATTSPSIQTTTKVETKSPTIATTTATAPASSTKTVTEAATSSATATERDNTPKTYNLLLQAQEDVWLRYQTDTDEIKDLTLRQGKGLMLRADQVIKIFSGNLGALKAKMNGSELDTLMKDKRSKSVVLPEEQAPNFSLPLFPQKETSDTTQTTTSPIAPTTSSDTSSNLPPPKSPSIDPTQNN
ncbi:MAG: helix-turn-helix domain-containing protein [Oligoflexia bacterium]|nr:helix-turn-helix domain-containing protein [Oligoflexia bacterium]